MQKRVESAVFSMLFYFMKNVCNSEVLPFTLQEYLYALYVRGKKKQHHVNFYFK